MEKGDQQIPLLIRALRGDPIERPPVWMMRQAGRYLSEYQEVKARHSFLEICHSPELALEVSLQPMRLFRPDAAIVFADILLPLEAMGIAIDFNPGPIISNPIQNSADIKNLRRPDSCHDFAYLLKTISALKNALISENNTPPPATLGFAGAPWTLACYLLSGGAHKSLNRAQQMAQQNPAEMELLLTKLTELTIDYLAAQIESGADAVQIFDTWAGNLSKEDYRRWALPFTAQIIERLKSYNIPLILYINGSSHLLPAMLESGAECLSICWRTELSDAAMLCQNKVIVQGNLDPTHLFAEPEVVRSYTRKMISKWPANKGYCANLGHGVLPETNPESVKAFVDAVKEGWVTNDKK